MSIDPGEALALTWPDMYRFKVLLIDDYINIED